MKKHIYLQMHSFISTFSSGSDSNFVRMELYSENPPLSFNTKMKTGG